MMRRNVVQKTKCEKYLLLVQGHLQTKSFESGSFISAIILIERVKPGHFLSYEVPFKLELQQIPRTYSRPCTYRNLLNKQKQEKSSADASPCERRLLSCPI